MNRPNKEIKRIARENLMGHYGVTMGAMLLANLIPTIILVPFSMLLNTTSVSQLIIYYLASFAISLLTIILSAGDSYLHLNLGRKKAFGISDLFHCFKERPDGYILAFLFLILKLIPCLIPAIVLIVAYALTEGTPFLVAGIILYILGIVFMVIVALNYSLVFLILIDSPYEKIREVFTHSKELMKGRKKQIFVLELSFLGWYMLGILSFGIGLLWIIPYFTQCVVVFYRDTTGDIA